MKDIQNSIALVTGANRGLGRALVEELLARGAAKVYATSRKPHDFEDSRVVNIPLDVTDAASITKLPELAPDVNLLVNNAGLFVPDTILSADMNNVRSQFETNVVGPIQIAQAMAPVLKANGGGILVEIISVGSWLPFGSYGSTKAALWSVTNSLRQELAPQGIRVVGVHIGPMDTEMTSMLDIPGKSDPADIARTTLDGVENGDSEVLTDDLSRHVKSTLSGPVDTLVFAG
jgi:NAD(P)-dependent dehydrogenase (short-subunit alcohol dehydrogenase family)